MSEATIAVNPDIIRALCLFTDKDPSKSASLRHLGINFALGREQCILTATDGRHLAAARLGGIKDLVEPITDCIVPVTLFSFLRPSEKRFVRVTIGRPSNGYRRPVSVSQCGLTSFGHTIETTYYDVRQMAPTSVSGEVAQFDPELIEHFAKAQKILCSRKFAKALTIAHNGDRPAVVDIGRDDFIGLIAPYRTGRDVKGAPDWLLTSVADEEQPQAEPVAAAA